MHWCEHNSVDFLFGLAKNALLTAAITAELDQTATHKLVDQPPAGPEWLYEIKFDGYRSMPGWIEAPSGC